MASEVIIKEISNTGNILCETEAADIAITVTSMVDALLTVQDSFIQSYINDSSACSTALLSRRASSRIVQVALGKSIREIATPAISTDWHSKIGQE